MSAAAPSAAEVTLAALHAPHASAARTDAACAVGGPAPAAIARRSAAPIDDAEFAALMDRLGPLERAPRLAVAVSGGPDSLALCLLAARWARARGGQVTGLIVDHGLRPEAAAEAAQTAAWLAARQIPHEVLAWRGPKPETGIQAAARTARYALLQRWCSDAAVLHLLLAHHADDQAETVALRRARASGPDGLAGMAAVRELAGVRLLRPLLGVPKARLIATLTAAGQPWLEDPGNRAPDFARGRLRRGPGLDVPALCRAAAAAAATRADLDRAVAAWLVATVRIDPAGFACLPRSALRDAAPAHARRTLQQILATIGGAAYPPRSVRLDRLLDELRAPVVGPVRRTLAGCRIVDRAGMLLVCREAGAIDHVAGVPAHGRLVWDDRFAMVVSDPGAGLTIRALGRHARGGLIAARPGRRLPGPVLPSLPALWRGARLLAVPHLGLGAPGDVDRPALEVGFRPRHPLAGAPFGVFPDNVALAWRAPMLR